MFIEGSLLAFPLRRLPEQETQAVSRNSLHSLCENSTKETLFSYVEVYARTPIFFQSFLFKKQAMGIFRPGPASYLKLSPSRGIRYLSDRKILCFPYLGPMFLNRNCNSLRQ